MAKNELFPRLIKKLRGVNPRDWKETFRDEGGGYYEYSTRIGRFRVVLKRVDTSVANVPELEIFDGSARDRDPLKSYSNKRVESLYWEAKGKVDDYKTRGASRGAAASLRDLSRLLQ